MGILLVVAETDGLHVSGSTLPAIAAAQAFCKAAGGHFDLLVAGAPEIAGNVDSWLTYGARRVAIAAHYLAGQLTAENLATACVLAMRQSGAAWVAGPASPLVRDALPRAAALLDLPLVTRILSVDSAGGGMAFRRARHGGDIIATVKIAGDSGAFTVEKAAFGDPKRYKKRSVVEMLNVDSISPVRGARLVRTDSHASRRPDLARARAVVIGGRALGDAANFAKLIGGLADKLGAAVGASGGAVSSGIAPDELLIGQTGKSIKPELCIVAGVSGVDQHIAGIGGAKVIVAINSDPDAPIFQIANYGLVADLNQALPELIEKLP